MNTPKPMLPTLSYTLPINKDWNYEIKYDGFRALLYVDDETYHLTSRNGLSFTFQFPEIEQAVRFIREVWTENLPLLFDGELCILDSPYKANFEKIQLRGRLKNTKKIVETMNEKSSHFCIFDLLLLSGIQINNDTYKSRKFKLKELFTRVGLPLEIEPNSPSFIQYIRNYESFEEIWKIAERFDSEGVIAKEITSKWEEGKRTTKWIKMKNWKEGTFFITSYEIKNGYFHVGVLRNKKVFPIGLVSHGFTSEEREALLTIMKSNKLKTTNNFIYVEPSICLDLYFLELYKDQLRQPRFKQFRFDLTWDDCTWEKLQLVNTNFPREVTITNPTKPLWPKKNIDKQMYLLYLSNIAPYLLPFLENRLLTVIRFPHGMQGEAFYQKNCPDYAPHFINTVKSEGINYIVCNNFDTLAWLGNQLAFEFHIPFQTIYSKSPSEIVFDLDPPSRDYFHLAVKAALVIKKIFDDLKLQSFIKTSGNKGLQIYLPLPEDTFSYEETRLFTEFIANFLISTDPESFTIERLKKNRGKKLYIDYLQHAEGKTIISPYSPRGNEDGLVATPLHWDEVVEGLSPEQFTLDTIIDRIKKNGNPFLDYFKVKETQPFHDILNYLISEK